MDAERQKLIDALVVERFGAPLQSPTPPNLNTYATTRAATDPDDSTNRIAPVIPLRRAS